MGQRLTFDEAVATWRRLIDPAVPEAEFDGSMLEACEATILAYPVGSHAQGAAVCAVLSHGTWGHEAETLDRLTTWLIALSQGSAEASGGVSADQSSVA